MKFLKLLDPYDIPSDNDITAAGKQQRNAQKQFPILVEESNLNYWRPGDKIATGTRLLIALEATYSLISLRLADILNDALQDKQINESITIDVFNIDDCGPSTEIANKYYPEGVVGYCFPITGVWQDQKFHKSIVGANMKSICSIIGIDEIELGFLMPPSKELLSE